MQMRSHDPYNEFSHSLPYHPQSRRLEESLRNRNIPYRIYGGRHSISAQGSKKDIVWHNMRLAVNPDDDEEGFQAGYKHSARGIGDTTVNRLIHTASALWRSM